MAAIRILSVDDEEEIEFLITQFFRRKIRSGEYEFFFAHNGVEGLTALHDHPDIEIILCDINMPEMDGLEMLAKGKEENWWQAQDKEMFKQKQQAMIEHFNKLEYMPGVYCDGKKTLGENIADLGGLEMAYEAYMKTVTATGEERNHLGREFFRAFAVAWMANATAKALEIYKTDEHAWHKLRVNGNVNLTDEWYDLFNIQSGKMYLKPEQRITIW